MRRPALIFACVVMALSGYALQAGQAKTPQPQAENFHISGTVVDAGSGAPLAKTTVLLASAVGTRKPIATVATGADGRFEFNHLTAGKYSLLAQRRGYLTAALDQHENYSTAVAVGPDLVSEGIIYRLHPDASLSGRALDDANEPVRSAQVMLFTAINSGRGRIRQVRTTQTDDEGAFRFPHLQPGTYLIAVSAQPWYAQHPMPFVRARSQEGAPEIVEPPASPLDVAYPLTFYSGATDAESATPIILSAGEHATADVTLRAVPALRLSVHTPTGTDTPGQPRPSVVNVRQKVLGLDVYIPAMARSGMPGGTEIAGLAPGRYEVSVTLNNAGSQTESHQEIDLRTNSDIEDTRSAVALVKVGGTLQIGDGLPPKDIPPFSVLLRDPKSGRASSAQVQANGKFEFGQSLAPGKYQVALAGRSIYLRSVRAIGALVSGHNVVIGSTPVNLTLVAGLDVGTVNGIAVRDGKPQPGAMVVLVPQVPAGNELLFRRDQSDSDGSFTLPSVVPGRYSVIALGRWDIPWQDPETLRTYMLHGQPIEVQPRGKYQIKVQVQ